MEWESRIISHLENGKNLFQNGKPQEAEKEFLSCLSPQPEIIQLGLKRTKTILKLQAKAACHLANLLSDLDKIGDALPLYLTAQKFDPDEIQYWIDFAYALRFAKIYEGPEVKEAIKKCLQKEGVCHQNLASAAISLIKDENDPLLALLIDRALIPDDLLELKLTQLRRNHPENTPLLYALSNQCFLNEYVYNFLPQEIKDLPTTTPEEIALAGAYFPLHTLHLEIPKGNDAFQRLVKRQIDDPLTERELSKTITALGGITDPLSQKVKQQYEENPYPRWTTANAKKPPIKSFIPELDSPNVLVAGCGTGLQAINAARYYKNATVLAIDFSLASLAYAKRMAQELNVSNLSFLQADILDLGQLQQTFDIIECVGVLHHMQDPVKGWKVLDKLLKPKGYMNIGVYSELGRRDVTAARKWIAQNRWKATAEDIRICRQEMMKLPEDCPFKRIVKSLDFYALSTCRDLLFHTHEVYFTIPQIEKILQDLKHKFLGFDLPPPLRPRYSLKELSEWHFYEEAHPDTFIGMYQFWTAKS